MGFIEARSERRKQDMEGMSSAARRGSWRLLFASLLAACPLLLLYIIFPSNRVRAGDSLRSLPSISPQPTEPLVASHLARNLRGEGSAPQAPQQDHSLVPNWSFEDPIPDGWRMESRSGYLFPILFWSSGIAHEGEHSAGIIDLSSDDLSSWASSPVPILGGEQLRFSGWVMTPFLSGRAYLNLTFLDANLSPLTGQGASSRMIRGGTGWELLSGELIAPREAAYVEVRCNLIGTGMVFFDEIILELVRDKVPILHIEKEGAPESVEPGSILVYTLSYSNSGEVTATGTVITDIFDINTIPQGSQPPPSRTGNGWWAWDLGTLGPGAGGVIVFTVTVGNSLEEGAILSNYVEMKSRELLQPLTDVLRTEVSAVPRLEISKLGQPKTAPPGETLVFTISYTNTGAVTVRDVYICDEFDSHISFTHCNPTPAIWGESQVFWSIKEVTPYAVGRIVCMAQVMDTAPYSALLQNCVDIRLAGERVYLDQDCEYIYTSPPRHALSIEPRRQEFEARPASSAVYTFTITNHGQEGDVITYALIGGGWPTEVYIGNAFLPPAAAAPLFLTVTVPLTAHRGEVSPMTLAVYSLLDSSISATAFITTVAGSRACLDISPGRAITLSMSAVQGPLTFTHFVTNCGNGADTITITREPLVHSWLTSAFTSVTKILDAGESVSVEIPIRVLERPASAESSTPLVVRIVSRVDPSVEKVAMDGLTIQSYHSFLPWVLKEYAEFCNGDFEFGDLRCWSVFDHPDFPVNVIPSGSDEYNLFSSYAVRIGRPGKVPDGQVPLGYFGIAQTIVVSDLPHPVLRFDYLLYTYDILTGTLHKDRIYDSLEVAIGDPTACHNTPLVPGACLWYTGRLEDPPGGTGYRGNHLWCSGLKHKEFDLSGYSGEAVTVYFLVSNRWFPEWNTWVYIDNIDGDFKFKR